MSNVSKIIEILDPQSGRIKETVLNDKPAADLNLFETKPGQKAMTLQEAVNTADFPVLLRDGIRSIAFDAYAGVPMTHTEWGMVVSSDKQQEDWVEENAIGELPIVPENTQYPEFKMDLDRAFAIKNYKRGGYIAVTEEVIRFNRMNLIKRQTQQLGRAAARTREVAMYSALTASGNYTRNSTTGDNEIGANTAATTFSATGLNTALTTLRTMKDRKSGVYFGVNPDTLIVAPRLEMSAKQLLLSPLLGRASASTTQEIYGTGTTNPFRGLVNRVIVSPYMGTSYQWALLEAKQSFVLQEVEGLQVLQERVGGVEHEGYFVYDIIRYRVRDWFGVGVVNDRFAYLSTSTSAPAVD